MKILSFGAGMQSTALALMSCENAVQARLRTRWCQSMTLLSSVTSVWSHSG